MPRKIAKQPAATKNEPTGKSPVSPVKANNQQQPAIQITESHQHVKPVQSDLLYGDESMDSPKSLTRQQKRFQKTRELKNEKKQLADAAGVNFNPTDPLQDERIAILNEVRKVSDVESPTDLTPDEIINRTNTQMRSFENLQNKLRDCVAKHTKLVKRPEERKQTAQQLVDTIMTLLKAPVTPPAEARTAHVETEVIGHFTTVGEINKVDQVEHLSELLEKVVCWENLKKFQTTAQELIEKLEKQKKSCTRALTIARGAVKKHRIIERLRATNNTTMDGDEAKAWESKITSQLVELQPDASKALNEGNLTFLLQRSFCVVLDWPAPPAGRKAVTIWGLVEQVESCADFLLNADFRESPVQRLDKQTAAAVIGTRGLGIRKIEKDHHCILNIDKDTLTIYGTNDNVNKALGCIQKIVDEVKAGQRRTVTLQADHPNVLKAISRFFSSDIQSIEKETDVHIIVGESQGHILLKEKLRDAAIDTAAKSVKELLSKIVKKEINIAEESEWIFHNYQRDTQKQLCEEMSALRKRSKVITSFTGNLFRVDGEIEEVLNFEIALEDIIIRSKQTPVIISLLQEQTRFVNGLMLNDIQAETGANCRLCRDLMGVPSVHITGTDEKQQSAKLKIEEILCDVIVEEVTYYNNETRIGLLKDKAEKLSKLQKDLGVFVSFIKASANQQPSPDKSQLLSIVGPAKGILAFKEVIATLEKESSSPSMRREAPAFNNEENGRQIGGNRQTQHQDKSTTSNRPPPSAMPASAPPQVPMYTSTEDFPSLQMAATTVEKRPKRRVFKADTQSPSSNETGELKAVNQTDKAVDKSLDKPTVDQIDVYPTVNSEDVLAVDEINEGYDSLAPYVSPDF